MEGLDTMAPPQEEEGHEGEEGEEGEECEEEREGTYGRDRRPCCEHLVTKCPKHSNMGSTEDVAHVRFADGPDPRGPSSKIIGRRATPGVHKPGDPPTPEEQMKDLHMKFRKMEASQRHFHTESESVLRRQQALLDGLHADNRSVQEKIDLFLAEDVLAEVARLRIEVASFNSRIDTEARRLSELDRVIDDFVNREYDARKSMGGMFAPRELHHWQQIHIKILENRIEKAVRDMDGTAHQNKCLQVQMMDLKVEHALHENRQARLEIELHSKIDEMGKLTDDCYSMYEQRDDFQRLISGKWSP